MKKTNQYVFACEDGSFIGIECKGRRLMQATVEANQMAKDCETRLSKYVGVREI